MHELLDHFFDLIDAARWNRFEGSVNQFLGDGFMALYGAPVAHEDHARRAVLAALAIRDRLADGIEVEGGPRGRDRGATWASALGFVVVSRIGENLRMDYTAIGDTTVVAARLRRDRPAGRRF